MAGQMDSHSTRAGMVGGAVLAMVFVSSGELLKTAILAAVGALVSYLISRLVRYLARLWQRLCRNR